MRLVLSYCVTAAGVLAAIRTNSPGFGLAALFCGVVAMGLYGVRDKR